MKQDVDRGASNEKVPTTAAQASTTLAAAYEAPLGQRRGSRDSRARAAGDAAQHLVRDSGASDKEAAVVGRAAEVKASLKKGVRQQSASKVVKW